MDIRLDKVTLVVLATWLLASSLAQAQSVPVSISVEVLKTPKEKDKHSTTRPTTGPGSEDRSLGITLNNTSDQAVPDLEVKYWLLVRDVKSKDITIGVTDSKTLTLAPSSETVVTSAIAKCDFTPRTGTSKPVPAKGNKFYGYGVQVLKDGKVASQTYDPDDVQTVIEGGAKTEK